MSFKKQTIINRIFKSRAKNTKLYQSLQTLVFGKSFFREEGASFANKGEIGDYLSYANNGLLINGKDLRLSERVSFQNVAVYGVTGKGKSTALARPIILDKGRSDSVLIVNDMSGDLYRDTSGYMKSKGYRIIVLNPNDLDNSNRYNPFLDIDTPEAVMRFADLFSRSTGDDKGSFWGKGAERYVRFFLKCLKTMPDVFNTPHNLYHLIQNFGDDGEDLFEFVESCCDNDVFLMNEWKSLITGAEETISGFIISATVALKIFSEPHVCALTSRSDIDLKTLRKQKTIIYLITAPEDQDIYQPLISMYFLSFLHACMRELPTVSDLPVYFIYDEFGNSYLPNFDKLITTTRKYNISLFLLMQGQQQLVTKYGSSLMNVILSGIATQISFGGAEGLTAEYFEKRAGKVRVYHRSEERDTHVERYMERNLINYSEIRELAENKLLIISDNRKTTIIDIHMSHESPRFQRMMKYTPAAVKSSKTEDRLVFIPL
ncbi:MAG: type IV secretory system conjugative DNA transfer family protein [Rhizobiales bacterium]|nr:type IV secretory system conjugative DNA transfer family protein [Hyphomicrobiales bacterium]